MLGSSHCQKSYKNWQVHVLLQIISLKLTVFNCIAMLTQPNQWSTNTTTLIAINVLNKNINSMKTIFTWEHWLTHGAPFLIRIWIILDQKYTFTTAFHNTKETMPIWQEPWINLISSRYNTIFPTVGDTVQPKLQEGKKRLQRRGAHHHTHEAYKDSIIEGKQRKWDRQIHYDRVLQPKCLQDSCIHTIIEKNSQKISCVACSTADYTWFKMRKQLQESTGVVLKRAPTTKRV